MKTKVKGVGTAGRVSVWVEDETMKDYKKELDFLRKALKRIIAYPEKGAGRHTKQGYPTECVYDQWAYERMVDSYRDGLRHALKDSRKAK